MSPFALEVHRQDQHPLFPQALETRVQCHDEESSHPIRRDALTANCYDGQDIAWRSRWASISLNFMEPGRNQTPTIGVGRIRSDASTLVTAARMRALR